jgi:predicted nucleic acid-binding protein
MLVDTAVWIDHFRKRGHPLAAQLEAAQVITHPFVIGELACGQIARRAEVLSALAALPHVPVVEHAEVLAFLTAHRLHGRGLGWIDLHLLASARLARVPFWTTDKRLASAAHDLALNAVVS